MVTSRCDCYCHRSGHDCRVEDDWGRPCCQGSRFYRVGRGK